MLVLPDDIEAARTRKPGRSPQCPMNMGFPYFFEPVTLRPTASPISSSTMGCCRTSPANNRSEHALRDKHPRGHFRRTVAKGGWRSCAGYGCEMNSSSLSRLSVQPFR
jgi:hypothetical protein